MISDETGDTALKMLDHGMPSRSWNMLLEDPTLAGDLERVISLLESLAAATIAVRESRLGPLVFTASSRMKL